MASNHSLAYLSRMRRETKQNNKTGTAQKPHAEKAKIVDLEEQASSVQSDCQLETSNDSRLKVVPEQTPSEIEEQKKGW